MSQATKASGVKLRLAKRRQALVKAVPLRKQSLLALKKRAMRNSLSSLQPVADASRPSFGFIPRGVEIEVLSWPKL